MDLCTNDRYVIKPATAERQCSYVELVASGPQVPAWFVSHWWGESVALFVRCLEQHAADHELGDDTPYWVCAVSHLGLEPWPLQPPLLEVPPLLPLCSFALSDQRSSSLLGQYANNQHQLGGDVTTDPSESSFVKAIELAEGRVLTVLDPEGVTYTRIWCCLEIFIGLGR